jgi:peptidoglycan/LPS O-acetylase OafA/YrhL
MGVDQLRQRRPDVAAAAAQPRLASLTRLRLLFIGWVLIYHLELALRALGGVPVIEPAVLRGYLGVDGFFVLSGFALFLGFHARPPRGLAGWGRFVAGRAARIWPLHAVALLALAALVAVAVAAGASVQDPQRFGGWEFVRQALLVNAWELSEIHAWNYPSWALSAIWAGYLAFPLVLAATLLVPPRAMLAVAAAALLGLLGLAALDPPVGLNWTLHLGLLRFACGFGLGIALARLFVAGLVPRGAALAGVALAPFGLIIGSDPVVVAGLAALILWCAASEAARPAGAPPRDLAWRLGEASFGVYLCWVFVEGALVLVLRATDPGQAGRLVLMLGGLALTLALGWLAWRVVEVPAARLLRR